MWLVHRSLPVVNQDSAVEGVAGYSSGDGSGGGCHAFDSKTQAWIILYV